MKIDQDILKDVIIISLKSANNYEDEEINVFDGKKQKLEFHINYFSYSEYDVCVIGKTSKDVYGCNNWLFDDAIKRGFIENRRLNLIIILCYLFI